MTHLRLSGDSIGGSKKRKLDDDDDDFSDGEKSGDDAGNKKKKTKGSAKKKNGQRPLFLIAPLTHPSSPQQEAKAIALMMRTPLNPLALEAQEEELAVAEAEAVVAAEEVEGEVLVEGKAEAEVPPRALPTSRPLKRLFNRHSITPSHCVPSELLKRPQ
jgi:hypothetical protein